LQQKISSGAKVILCHVNHKSKILGLLHDKINTDYFFLKLQKQKILYGVE